MRLLAETPGLLAALAGERTPKFLATRSPAGEPNVVPCLSLTPDPDSGDIVFFGNFLLRKSVKNLEADGRVGILVLTPRLEGWTLTGDFVEFQRSGPYVDQQNSSRMLRYNAYTGIRNAGVIRLRSVEATFSLSRFAVAKDFLLARLSALRPASYSLDEVKVPLAVQREIGRMAAVKALAWIGSEGYPFVAPALSLQPRGDRQLVMHLRHRSAACPGPSTPLDGASVATNVLTAEAISYQTKGTWQQRGNTGTICVHSVYAGGPPLPGARIA